MDSSYRELTTYDLVSRGGDSGHVDKCWGTYDGTNGWGPTYQNNCIHSGLIKTSGDMSTVWYNYVLATAGTIVSENTSSSNPANNTTTATESICPKGWTLPDKAMQANSIRGTTYIDIFSPTRGGYYHNATLNNETTEGLIWTNEAFDGARRWYIYYGASNSIGLGNYSRGGRPSGVYIRCVQKST